MNGAWALNSARLHEEPASARSISRSLSRDHRPDSPRLGGGIEFGEHSRAAVEREIREELGAEVTGLHLLTVIENHFTYEGREHHEVVFVYDGAFADTTLYDQELFTYFDGAAEIRAVWKALADFDEQTRLLPNGLLAYLRNAR